LLEVHTADGINYAMKSGMKACLLIFVALVIIALSPSCSSNKDSGLHTASHKAVSQQS